MTTVLPLRFELVNENVVLAFSQVLKVKQWMLKNVKVCLTLSLSFEESMQILGDKIEYKNCDEICKMGEVHKLQAETQTKPPLTAMLESSSNIAEWKEWQPWLGCSVSCGSGIRER